MTTIPTPAYERLAARHAQLHRLGHFDALAFWDQAAFMPAGGNEARAAARAELAGVLHRLRTEPALRDWLAAAEAEPLDDWQRANLREMRREWRAANALPESLVQARQIATARCEHAWRTQRPANDWTSFAPNLREVVRLAREEARCLAEASGLAPYDALVDRFEPGMTAAVLDRLFGEVRAWLPGLIERIVARQAGETTLVPQGPFPPARQKLLCERVMGVLGFDFERGRLDASAHPFCGGVPEDVRLTTRYRDDEFLPALMGTIHETGHGRYEQNRPRAWIGQPVSEARSAAIHESQSLCFEMQLGSHDGFAARVLAPLVAEVLGAQAAFEPANFRRLVTRVKPGLIRVDADEATYAAHVILRYEIERALIEGAAEVGDIPAMWDERMRDLLGLDTRGNYRDGPMQDVHWPEGLFGYFPSYSLGAMYAAQWTAAARRAVTGLDARLAEGDVAALTDWLREHIWSMGSRHETDELARRASGTALDPAHWRAHLEARYLA